MPATDELVDINMKLPRSVIERVDKRVQDRHSTRERQLAELVESGLEAELTWQERMDRLSNMHRARMEQEGKANQTEEEIWEELRRTREEVANEYDPD